MRLLLVRHAEPDYSRDSLTEKGWREAELLSRRLIRLRGVEGWYTSPLGRARDTASRTLEKLGVTEIECLGEKFDPAMHNAVMHVDDEDKGENEIVEVFQKGFKLGDKVIRFAMVKVAN